MDTYWGKIKRDSQYQLEEVFDWTAHLEHLQAVLREFDPAAASNEEIMIRCFLEGLRAFIRAQIDVRGRDLSSWEEAVEKTVNAEAKTMLQSCFITRNMDSRCQQGNRPSKKEKEEKDSGKNKSTKSTPADTSSRKQSSSAWQTPSAKPKNNQDHQQGPRRRGGQGQGCNTNSPATGVNIVSTKEGRDMSQVECYNCHRKRHYSNKCPRNPKKQSKN